MSKLFLSQPSLVQNLDAAEAPESQMDSDFLPFYFLSQPTLGQVWIGRAQEWRESTGKWESTEKIVSQRSARGCAKSREPIRHGTPNFYTLVDCSGSPERNLTFRGSLSKVRSRLKIFRSPPTYFRKFKAPDSACFDAVLLQYRDRSSSFTYSFWPDSRRELRGESDSLNNVYAESANHPLLM